MAVPRLSLTLLRLVLARWVAGEYSTDQVRAWLAHDLAAQVLLDELHNAPEMTIYHGPLRDASEAGLLA